MTTPKTIADLKDLKNVFPVDTASVGIQDAEAYVRKHSGEIIRI